MHVQALVAEVVVGDDDLALAAMERDALCRLRDRDRALGGWDSDGERRIRAACQEVNGEISTIEDDLRRG